MTTKAVALISLLAVLTAGCTNTDRRIPEEKAADQLEMKLKERLVMEERRTIALRRQTELRMAYAVRLKELRTTVSSEVR